MDNTFFGTNRSALLKQLKSGGLVVVGAYNETQRSNDSANRFQQEGNFWYLTGIEEADWWLIMDGVQGVEWLVSPERSEMQIVFDGSADHDEVKKISGIKTIIT